ncbi:MAG: beta-ketoacyl-[acyl-carrier-protein] synthase family protein [Flavobacteriales bacterium]|nr:beta-ketoacyl-[acyl-carrier-protein] synthase family protein [Flavobacteriales bacterium]
MGSSPHTGPIVVSGTGMVTALGAGVPANLEALLKERTGIAPLRFLETRHRGSLPAGEVPYNNEELAALARPGEVRGWTRTALMGLLAVREALQGSGLDPKGPRTGFISATTAGGIASTEPIYHRFFEDDITDKELQYLGTHDPGEHAERIAQELGCRSIVTTISTACSSSANAIMLGSRLIRHGLLDAAIVGGTDALCKYTVNGFNSLMILDPEPCRPFDASRRGLNLGEAGAFLVLEPMERARARGATVLGVVSGFANTNDAYHATASSPQGDGALLAMQRALDMAGVAPGEVDHINVHGTGTENNDLSEGHALRRLFGTEVPQFSSTKSFTGHTLGAAGAVEAIYSLLAIQEQVMFANLRFTEPLPETGLIPIVATKKTEGLRHVLSNSFGFGGNNTSLLISAP